MLFKRMLEAERRRSAPIGCAALAVLKAGTAVHARRWGLAAREAGLERLAREARRAAALERGRPSRDEARAARLQRELCFYRMHALRCRDAA